MLGLPDGVNALLFDLDGVLTKTATVHAKAWKEMFDAFLKERDGDGYTPFDVHRDYDEYVDGKPRQDGVKDFLKSRGIDADAALVQRLGDEKNDLVQQVIERDGVEVYEGSVDYVRKAKAADFKLAVVSSSANAKPVLRSVGILDLFDDVVDGHAVAEGGLKGKPAPDTFLEGARRLAAEPARAVVFEDALAGVEAGRAGKFGYVVGVDRVGQAQALREHGASVVVSDLSELA
ncbi:MAG TPA: beta-phosphoglucomutase family hydrolase [Baekduia sp.]|uniref:HAD family hydrolase n=1 Tax=Baekduia sp. TaxID=2600305 RepID=UPI002D78C3CC|nr:beta-phosphoglucomutase family hydrolase [Baekduia sp.]HET6510144.1 beta-phosphoglucomutase family hydrolase [Baekduia sp.]